MKEPINQSYYAFGTEDRKSNELPLVVNCAGEVAFKKPFANRCLSGRLDYYLIYMNRGRMHIKVGSLDGEILAGQFILIPEHTPFAYESTTDEGGITAYYWIHFTGSDVTQILRSAGIEAGVITEAGIHADTADAYESLFAEFRKRKPNFTYSTSIRVQQILLSLASHAENEARPATKALDISIRYIHAHIRSPLSVKALSQMEFLSVSRYRQLFHEATGMSPTEYITALRIHRACDLITQGVLTIDRIAELSGYPDRLYFQRIFKKHTGLTPAEYRRRHS